VLIINRVIGYEGEELKTMAEKAGVTVAGLVPQDEAIFKFDLEGKPVIKLPEASKSVQALFGILTSLNV
jgi:CO dehydrogenase maturation factor